MIDFNTRTNGFPHVTESGRKRATIANLKHLFEQYKITVTYDEMLKEQVMILGNDFDKGHSDLIANSNISHLKSILALNDLSQASIDLLPALFAENSINPILNYIESVPWDGRNRIIELADTITVSKNDYDYAYLALKTWLIQCVAAADGARRTPNKNALPKYEIVFVLQGGQGAQKTSWFGKLLPRELERYIIDGVHLDPSKIDSVREANSCWICELGELDATFKTGDVSRLKAFLSKRFDTLRLPYDRAHSRLGRRTSFCGSVNPDIFLVDATGNRRFVPVQVLDCNYEHTVNMQQVWAEVLHLYLGGEIWWCDDELEHLLVERHQRHAQVDPLTERIAEKFDMSRTVRNVDHKHYTPTRVLQECGISNPKQKEATTCSSFLKSNGFELVASYGVKGYWIAMNPPRYDKLP